MPKINVFLLNEYRNAYGLTLKKNFSEPKIYDANGDLSKRWYVHFSFRNPQTGLLEKQTPIYGGANRFKTKQERYEVLNSYRKALLSFLNEGLSPYEDNSILLDEPVAEITVSESPIVEETQTSIKEAFAIAVATKSKVLNKSSFSSFNSSIKRFQIWLNDNGFENKAIDTITKKTVIEYLNIILAKTSPRTRNNTRIDLSSLFQELENNEIIKNNFVRKINVLKATPERNKTYTPTLQNDIFRYMEENDPLLLLFVKFVSYNFLRPVEVCRLRIQDIDLVDKKLYVKAKNSPVKIKIIPQILIDDLPDLSKMNSEDFLFIVDGIGGEWKTSETDKRNFFSKRFKKVKDHFNLGKEYTLYSFRHTFITKLYNEFIKTMTPYEAKSILMLITGHKTMEALEKYLREIDAILPEDYSHHLKQ